MRDTRQILLSVDRRVTPDLGDVSLIERPVLSWLASLSRRSVALVHCSPFQEALLRQAIETTSENTAAHGLS